MTLAYLRRYRRVFLSTPYAGHPHGRDAAYEAACSIAGALMKEGVKVYCPISHGHGIAKHAGIDPTDNAFWLDPQAQDDCDALVIAQMDGWLQSAGISGEIAHAALRDQPTYALDPETMKLTKWGYG